MTTRKLNPKVFRAAFVSSGVMLVSILFCSDLLHHLDNWGFHDWGIFYFHNISVYRTVVEFGEAPLWNPWCLGGMPLLANPQTLVPDPWFGLDLLFGPILAIRLKIVAHYAIGLTGAYWCARCFRLSKLAAIYFAGTFIFSTWLALHLQAGHLSFLCAVYIPWVVGLFQRSRYRVSQALCGSMLLTLMAFQGGVFVLIFTAFITGILAVCWSAQDRSARPVLSLLLMWACFTGLSALKLMPMYQLMRDSPRVAAIGPAGERRPVVGGTMWTKYKSLLFGQETDTEPNSTQDPSMAGSENASRPVQGSTEPVRSFSSDRRKASKWDMPAFLVKVFLGRQQRSLQIYYPLQGFGWHEYGAYLGPLAVLLLIVSPCVILRPAWPWMVVGAVCFLVALGNFAPFAPWTILHHLPAIDNMRAPGRFLIPCAFASAMLASIVLDELVTRFSTMAREDKGSPDYPRRSWVQRAAMLLVALALVDSFLVGRHSLQGAFPTPPPLIEPKLPSIVTVQKCSGGQVVAPLANYSVLSADEAIVVPIGVTPREDPHYRGELYFASDSDRVASVVDRVELLDWSPNTVLVGVDTKNPGWVVLNRNWARGWVAEGPYKVAPYGGLIAVHIQPGAQTIQFRYRPSIFRLGLTLSITTFAIMAAAFIWLNRSPGTLSEDSKRKGEAGV